MKAGIIAAGHGSRLARSHPHLVKPLVPVAGKPLCHWVARSLAHAGADEIAVLHNSDGFAVRQSLREAFPRIRWTFLQADTASSWESFRLISRTFGGSADSFLVSTVDALVPPEQAALFARAAAASQALAGMALTSFVDDEKPLWASVGHNGLIDALGEDCRQRTLVTCGLYYMTAALSEQMPDASTHASLRSYWGGLVAAQVPVLGHRLTKTIDVDRPEDIAEAEGFLKEAVATW